MSDLKDSQQRALHKVQVATAMRDLGEWPIQKFHVSHLKDANFVSNGLRAYATYRDLGMAEATGGLVEAHVSARAKPFNAEEVSQRHFHDVKFQMVYVLKGWTRFEFEGYGEHFLEEGSCWIQPAGIKHTQLDYSDDLEVLEIVIPATHQTVALEK